MQLLHSRPKDNTSMYLLAGFIVPGISEDCSVVCERFEKILVFYCEDAQAAELEVPVALAACSSEAERFRRSWTFLFSQQLLPNASPCPPMHHIRPGSQDHIMYIGNNITLRLFFHCSGKLMISNQPPVISSSLFVN